MFGFSRKASLKVAAGAVCAAAVLTACGGPVKIGAAAVFASGRITTATLDTTVVDWQRDMKQHPDVIQQRATYTQQAKDQVAQGMVTWEQARLGLPFDPDSATRTALNRLVGFQVWDEVAVEQQISVTQGQVDATIAGHGGRRAIDNQMLLLGLPVSHTPDLVRSVLIRGTLLTGMGATADQQGQPDPVSQKRLSAIFVHAASTLKVKVNPRYGTYDPAQEDLALPTTMLSKGDPGLYGAPRT